MFLDPFQLEQLKRSTRRQFLGHAGTCLGAIALTSLLNESSAAKGPGDSNHPLTPRPPHFPARAKNVIYLHMSGSPSQLDMFDHKPKLSAMNGQPCPESLFSRDRFAFIRGVPTLLGSPHQFAKHGQCGAEVSNLLPHVAGVADDLTIIKTVVTEQINHAPAQIFLTTGNARPGRPSLGAWLTYGLGSESQNLPGFVVLISGGHSPDGGASLWGSGFLPGAYQGVQFRSQGDPVLFVSNPQGMNEATRRRSLDALRDLNERHLEASGDPETQTRIEQYELAYRMQSSAPELMELSSETAQTHKLYGSEPGKVSFANNCLLARRMVERGVRFVQLYHYGWDSHGTSSNDDLVTGLPRCCRETDQACAALIKDLKQRGLLDSTLVIWGGEFGRTPMNEERAGSTFLGRDHHPHCFTMWMAGGGVKPGLTYGKSDELGYHVAEGKVHVHDLQATILHLLGLDHERLTYFYQGREFRLTDVFGKVVKPVLA